MWIVGKLGIDFCYKLFFFLKLHPQGQDESTPTLVPTILKKTIDDPRKVINVLHRMAPNGYKP
jgi:hypothetical protein